MFKTFAAALIAANALGVKVQTGSQVHQVAEETEISMCEASLEYFLAQFPTSYVDGENKLT